jgi:hypothetical protein
VRTTHVNEGLQVLGYIYIYIYIYMYLTYIFMEVHSPRKIQTTALAALRSLREDQL